MGVEYKAHYCRSCALEGVHTCAREGDSKALLACFATEGQNHVCIACRIDGKNPNDFDDYWCSYCWGRRGHLAFLPMDALKARLTRSWERVGYCKICRERVPHPDVETPAARSRRISAQEAKISAAEAARSGRRSAAEASASAASQSAPKYESMG